jgi:hypothetical protein
MKIKIKNTKYVRFQIMKLYLNNIWKYEHEMNQTNYNAKSYFTLMLNRFKVMGSCFYLYTHLKT